MFLVKIKACIFSCFSRIYSSVSRFLKKVYDYSIRISVNAVVISWIIDNFIPLMVIMLKRQ